MLTLVTPDGSRVEVVDDIVVGRDPSCTLVLPDATVSRRHAAFRIAQDGGLALEDLGSTYGTWLDGRRIERAPLRAVESAPAGVARFEPRREALVHPGGNRRGGRRLIEGGVDELVG